MPRILLTHAAQELDLYYGTAALARLSALATVGRLPAGASSADVDGVIDAARDCELIVSYRASAAPARLFDALPRLVGFVRCAVDIRNVDVAAASRRGVAVTQASAGFVPAVAEWIVGAMIDLARGLSAATEAYHAGRAPAVRLGSELRGATLGLIGFGRIARYLAPVAGAFGMRVVAHDPHTPVDPALAEPVSFDTLLAGADFVACLAVATAETENLMDDRAFARMKRGAFFVNASRGNLVDEAALARALDDGRLAGCALDVGRATDQMPTPSLAAHPRVIATPHAGGLTRPAIEHQAFETVEQAAALLAGRVPEGCVNPGDAWRLRAAAAGQGLPR